MKSILAIDVSTKRLSCAFRAIDWPDAFGVIPSPFCFEVSSVPGSIQALADTFEYEDLAVVAVEGCYLSRNAKTYAQLFHVKELVLEAFRAKRAWVTVMEVSPTQWRVAVLRKSPEKVTGIKREEWHRRALAHAEGILGYVPPSQDLADAVCLLHAVSSGALEEVL